MTKQTRKNYETLIVDLQIMIRMDEANGLLHPQAASQMRDAAHGLLVLLAKIEEAQGE